jgi:beta-phosphoglucomutase-like phosphatase (HAD superfamily)
VAHRDQSALHPDECLAFEDSHNGLLSARGAGLSMIVTPSLNTRHETVDGAAMVPPDPSDFDLAASGFASEAGPA